MSYLPLKTEMVSFEAHGSATGEANYARPNLDAKMGGVILVHHLPGWDDWIQEAARRIAHNGFACIAPNLYFRNGPGTPDDVGARVRAQGGVPDEQFVGDMAGCMKFLRAQPESNGKVAIMGFCSGGRHAWLAGCSLKGLDAIVDCWGGAVIVDDPKELTAMRPVAPIDLTANMTAPVLGIFGNEDQRPSPDQVNRTEEVLKKLGKQYEFHRYDGVGHGFFAADRPAYRAEQATDGWRKVVSFLDRQIGPRLKAH